MPTPSSASTVTTIEVLSEATLAIHSFLFRHPVTPVYVACPVELASQVALIHSNVVPVPRELRTPDRVSTHNGFHRPDAILLKMDAMEVALQNHPDTFFFDADLVFFHSVTTPNDDAELVLSLNLAETADMGVTAYRYGLFNAGFLWTSSRHFPEWWRNAYLNPSQKDAFYEQTCLSLAPILFRTSYFNHLHNYGPWRGPLGSRLASSVHCHMTKALKLDQWMLPKTVALRGEVIDRIPAPLLPILHETCDHPKRVFFIHYGKTAGVYCNIAFKKLLRGYANHDSWVAKPGGEARDWTSSELEDILTTTDDGYHYLHQHHVKVSACDVELAMKMGWKTVMFYRDPREIICSLFHWGNSLIAETGFCHVFDEPRTTPHTFGEFFYRIIRPEFQHKWALPYWHGMVDHLQPFSPAALDDVCEELVGATHKPHTTFNASANQGWEIHLLPEHLAILEGLPRYRRSMEWLRKATEMPELDSDTPLPLERFLSLTGSPTQHYTSQGTPRPSGYSS